MGWLADQYVNKPVTWHLDYIGARQAAGETPSIDHTMEAFWNHAIAGNDQLRARVMFALSQIFVVSCDNGPLEGEAVGMSAYVDVLNRHALGNFRALLEEITLHPSMGLYLDMLKNDKEDPATGREPNENFAREILQLFSIGLYQLNPDGTLKLSADGLPIETYNQETIENFARVFTGWNWANSRDTTKPWQWTWPPVRNFRLSMQAWPEHHSTGEKVLLNGFRVPANQTPEKDLKDALDNIFNHPNVPPFIARQLIQRMVTSNPSPAYVYRVAKAFENNGSGTRGDMKAVIRAILMDYEARSLNVVNDQGYGKQREPVIRFAHLFRAFNIRNADGRYRIHRLESPLWGLGQNPLRAPTVFNFFEPNFAQPGAITQAGLVSPEFQITTETSIIGSANTIRGVTFNGYNGNSMTTTYAEYTPLAANPAQLVDQLNLVLMNQAMSSGLRTRIINAITSIPTTRTTWQVDRVKNAIWLITLSPEFVIQK
jgi:endo-chitodextinase